MLYRAHVNGFTGRFTNLVDLKVWVNDLRSRHDLAGQTLLIWRAVGAVLPTAAQYNSKPDREIVL